MKCKCGHEYEDHTFAMDNIGCDKCDCRANLVMLFESEIGSAVLRERERCAKVCEEWQSSLYPVGEDVEYDVVTSMLSNLPKDLAEQIRKG